MSASRAPTGTCRAERLAHGEHRVGVGTRPRRDVSSADTMTISRMRAPAKPRARVWVAARAARLGERALVAVKEQPASAAPVKSRRRPMRSARLDSTNVMTIEARTTRAGRPGRGRRAELVGCEGRRLGEHGAEVAGDQRDRAEAELAVGPTAVEPVRRRPPRRRARRADERPPQAGREESAPDAGRTKKSARTSTEPSSRSRTTRRYRSKGPSAHPDPPSPSTVSRTSGS